MRSRSCLLFLFVLFSPTLTVLAQTQPGNTVRTLLAVGRIGSVVDAPLHFRLFAVRLPALGRVAYAGPNSMVYGLSGGLTIAFDGSAHAVSEGAGAFIPQRLAAIFSVPAAEPASFLQFVLSPAGDSQTPLSDPAIIEELYRTPEPLPGLKTGPYEFSLTRVSLPAGMPANPIHYRSGAALYYVIAGSGLFIADGKTERRIAGMPHFERYGWAHQWANPGESPLVLLQANISQEGIPAVLPGVPPTAPK
jgi:quercetin dioxygenase-like cupin family protein